MILSSTQNKPQEFKAFGQKAFNLAKLKSAGFPVPDFICLTEEDTRYPEKILDALSKACPKAVLFAVRSSAAAEDSAAYTYAGQFHTYLRVPVSELIGRIHECFASVNAPSVLAYSRKIGAGGTKMSVIIQAMVLPQLSGVLFTANPLGILSETVIVAGRGDGDGVVNGRTDTVTCYHNRPDGFEYMEKQGNAPNLSDKWKTLLLDTAGRLEQVFGPALDVEYAIAEDKLWLLQLRPITTLSNSAPLVLDNSNIVESYPGITLPLTISFVHSVYGDIFESLLTRLTGSSSLTQNHPDIYRELTADYNGRIYYHISHWYAVLELLPFSGKIIPVWQEMLGVATREFEAPDIKVSLQTKLTVLLNTIRLLLTVPRSMKKLEQDFTEMKEYFDSHYKPGLSWAKLWKLYHRMNRLVLRKWDLTLANDMYTFLHTALLKSMLKRQGLTASQINRKISGISNLTSMKPVRALLQLSLKYRREGNTPSFQKQFSHYISLYGDRCIGELKLETKTYRESPDTLMQQIDSYAAMENLENLTARLSRKTAPSKDGPLLHNLTARAAQGIYYRESSRMNRSRLYGFARTLFLDMGKLLTEQGKLELPEDVFYLTLEELQHPEKAVSFRSIVLERKSDYAFYTKLPAYKRIVFDGRIRNKTRAGESCCSSASPESRPLHGIPCSSGKARAEVLIITDPSQQYNTSGKILVTTSTDPGWVFLLAQAAGIISEKGSLLSHTAIISRELKIPAIAGVSRATEILQNGELVEMDCETGVIQRL